jgi:hypothetical protein
MKANGRVSFGGVAIGNGVEADITLEDGTNWRFVGAAVGFEFGAGGGTFTAEGDLNKDTLPGMCFFTLIGMAIGKGEFKVTWNNVGNLQGKGFGVGVPGIAGFGHWSQV